MKKKVFVVLFAISIAMNLAVICTFGYLWASERSGEKSTQLSGQETYREGFWIVRVRFDMPELDPHAVQFAFFDFNPIADLKERIKGSSKIYNDFMERYQTEVEKKSLYQAAIRRNWDEAFASISGDQVHMLTQGFAQSSNGPSGKLWLVTKVTYVKDKPICWCISFQPEFGKAKTIVLNKKNTFDISTEFDEGIIEGSKDSITQYAADPAFKDEAEAHRLYNKMIKAFENAKTLYYESNYWFGREGVEPREATYKIWLKKPNYARMEAAKNNRLTGTLIGDGEFFWIYWGNKIMTFEGEDFRSYGDTTYMQIASPQSRHSLAHMAGKLKAGIAMLTFQPSRFHGGGSGLDEYLDGVRSAGTEIVNGEKCSVIEVSFMNNQRSQYYWISEKDFLPRKIMEVVRAKFTVLSQEVWSNIFVNMAIPDALFSWEPPQGWTQYFEPEWQDNLLEPGTEAPNFELKSIDGNKVKLSSYNGKIVLLNFWRVGCPPAREEITYLERLYKKYKDMGLVVISINTSDDHKIALDFLRKNSVTYINVIDASRAAGDIQHTLYEKATGRSAVPMNYLIDRDGKVIEAWYGFTDEGDESPANRLKPLGFE